LSAPNQPTQPGILMFLSNNLGIKGYTNCEVQIIEFGRIGSEDETINKADMNTFKKGGTNYPGDPYDNAFIGSYRYANKSWEPVKPTFTMKNDKYRAISMFDDILYFMSYQRQIQTTPNNPVSSRSHVVICLTVGEKKIIFLDLAGNENEFICDINDALKFYNQ
jgi:hypothetical protein